MPKQIRLREMSAVEEQEISRLEKSRKEADRLVQRAKIIEAMLERPGLTASAAGLVYGSITNW